jgi:hypothetical protein
MTWKVKTTSQQWHKMEDKPTVFGQGEQNKRNAKIKSNYLAFTILQGWLRPISLQGVGNIF